MYIYIYYCCCDILIYIYIYIIVIYIYHCYIYIYHRYIYHCYIYISLLYKLYIYIIVIYIQLYTYYCYIVTIIITIILLLLYIYIYSFSLLSSSVIVGSDASFELVKLRMLREQFYIPLYILIWPIDVSQCFTLIITTSKYHTYINVMWCVPFCDSPYILAEDCWSKLLCGSLPFLCIM
jgi:hypothetical protein